MHCAPQHSLKVEKFQQNYVISLTMKPGMYSTLQNWPGRIGYWGVGVPPSGPMDHLSMRVANRLVENEETA